MKKKMTWLAIVMLAFAACQIYAGIRYGLPVACVVGGCLAGACIGILGNIHKADK